MKAVVTGFAGCLALFLAAQGDDEAQAKAKLQGTWTVVKLETDKGEQAAFRDATLVFAKDTVEMRKTDETKKGTYKLNTAAKPMEIDVTPDDKSDPMRGIFVVEKDELKICLAEGSETPRPKAFDVPADSRNVLIILKRSK